jgi:hypothetical protein
MKQIALFATLALTLWAHGQTPIVRTEIASIALADSVQDLHFWNGKQVALFQANPTGLGEALTYEGPELFELRKHPSEFTQKPPRPAPVASVRLPLKASRVLIACLQSKDQALKLVAYDISKTTIDEGDYRFFNFSHSVLAIQIGSEKFSIAPGKSHLASHSTWRDAVTQLDVAMAVRRGKNFSPVYSSQWGHRPGRRNFILLFDGHHEYQPIKISRVFDIAPKDPPPKNQP